MFSIAIGSRGFKWMMLSLSRPKLLIDFITRSAVNVCALVTTRVSREEVCLNSFEVLNCWLNLVGSCLEDENEFPLR